MAQHRKNKSFDIFVDEIKVKKPFFTFKPSRQKKDLNLIDNIISLLDSCPSNPPADVINKCRQFIELHRIMENTCARRRLERWATRVISSYLLIVLSLLIANGIILFIYGKNLINDKIMITILSTTAINIIGLVIIVLKGYFFGDDIKKEQNVQLPFNQTVIEKAKEKEKEEE